MKAYRFPLVSLVAAAVVFATGMVASAAEGTPEPPAAVPTLSHRTIFFHMRDLTTDGSKSDLIKLTFKAARSGPATVLARGYCNMDLFNVASPKEINLDLHLTTATAFSSDVATWGVARELPQTAAHIWTGSNWTALREFSAVKGTQYSVVLSAREFNSTALASDCSGTVTLDIAQ
jgi:hypothetical protein